MKFKIPNPKPFQPGKARYKAPEYLTVEQLPSGKLDAFEVMELLPTPKRPDFLVCDCCLTQTDRLWLRQYRGFCTGFPNAGRRRREYTAGVWGFCVYCWPLFERGEIEVLVARVATLNPELDPRWVEVVYHVLAQAVHGEPSTWEGGQEISILRPTT